jgi:outer membrane protein OmpA-like peptidoglycan-associated protein
MLKHIFSFTTAIFLYFSATAQQTNLNAGLIAHYPFEDGARDAAGMNDGQINGARLEDNMRCGNRAYYFDGKESYIDCGNDHTLNGRFSGLTIATWIRPMDVADMELSTIVAKWAFHDQKDHFGMWLNSSYRIIMAVSAPGNMEDGTFSSTQLMPEEWWHVVGTWRANGEIRIYINGKLDKVGKQTGYGINTFSDATMKIGRQVTRKNRPYKGYIDEMRIYRRALLPEEVSALYNLGNLACEKLIVQGNVYNKNTGEPVASEVVFEYLDKGTTFGKIKTEGPEAFYQAEIPIGERFGFYAEADGYLSENQNLSTKGRQYNEVIERDLYVIPLEAGATITLNNIFFDFDQATLREESFLELNRILPFFRKYPNLIIELGGHTDSFGSDAYNQKLSQDRARAVRSYILSQGIPNARVEAVGYGEVSPVASNDSDEGRQMNRRVEFKVLRN